jgi:hypothetical protein
MELAQKANNLRNLVGMRLSSFNLHGVLYFVFGYINRCVGYFKSWPRRFVLVVSKLFSLPLDHESQMIRSHGLTPPERIISTVHRGSFGVYLLPVKIEFWGNTNHGFQFSYSKRRKERPCMESVNSKFKEARNYTHRIW